jgi:hypothetical protein
MSTEEFDRRIDAGGDSTEIIEHKIIPNHDVPATRRVNVDLAYSFNQAGFSRRRERDFQAIFDQNLVVRKD